MGAYFSRVSSGLFQSVDSRWNDDDLDEADEEKDERGAGHVSPKPGVHLFGVLKEGEDEKKRMEQYFNFASFLSL